MDGTKLKIANKLNEEIKELDDFIFTAEKTWTGKINLKQIISNSYGELNQKEFNMDTKIKNKVLTVLREYLVDLKKELESI